MGVAAAIAGAGRTHGSATAARDALTKAGLFKSPNVDPYLFTGTVASEEYNEVHEGAGSTYNFLRWVGSTPYSEAIKGTRIAQILEFCIPRDDDKRPGMIIRPWDRTQKVTKGTQKLAREIMQVIMAVDRGAAGYDTLAPAVRALMGDSYDLDQANFEVAPDRRGKPAAWMPVDASLMRLAKIPDADLSEGRYYPKPEDPRYVKLWAHDSSVAVEYRESQMLWGIRNRRTHEYVRQYGHPELIMAAPIITDLLDAMTFNSTNFKSGVHSNAIVEVNSTMQDEAHWAFKNSIRAMLTGRLQAKKLPLFFMKPGDAIKVHTLGNNNHDMEFSQYVSFLLKVLCAVFRMDPAELNFVFGNEGQHNSLQGQGPAERIIYSQERGLKPDLRHLAWWFTSKIVKPYHGDFILEFTGFDAPSDEQRIELAMKAMRTHLTPNEFRQQEGLPRLSSPAADTPLDQAYLAAAQGEGGPDDAPDDFMGDAGEREPFAKGLRIGDDVDSWTSYLVDRADEAMRQGRIVQLGKGRRGVYRMVPVRNRRGVLAMLVEDRRAAA